MQKLSADDKNQVYKKLFLNCTLDLQIIARTVIQGCSNFLAEKIISLLS